jgi:transposase
VRKRDPQPWIVNDDLWPRVQVVLPPKKPRRSRNPGRYPVDDRKVLCGILFVLHTGIRWEWLPAELGFGSGMTRWRRLRDWNNAGVWQHLHELLLAELNSTGKLNLSRAVIDSSQVRALKGGPKPGRARSTAPDRAPSTT